MCGSLVILVSWGCSLEDASLLTMVLRSLLKFCLPQMPKNRIKSLPSSTTITTNIQIQSKIKLSFSMNGDIIHVYRTLLLIRKSTKLTKNHQDEILWRELVIDIRYHLLLTVVQSSFEFVRLIFVGWLEKERIEIKLQKRALSKKKVSFTCLY